MIAPTALRQLPADGWLLFATRFIRLFAYGSLSVVLVFYLIGAGLSEPQIGTLLTLTLAGDTVVSLLLTTRADRIGRRRTLVAGAALMAAAGVTFASTGAFWLLVLAGTVGVISPSGNEVGPFLAVEQASLSQITEPTRRTTLFARYQLVGALATAAGAAVAGVVVQAAGGSVSPPADAYRAVIVGYALAGVVLGLLFAAVSPAVEVPVQQRTDVTVASRLGLHRSQRVVLRLSALFALDAFAGGFVMLSFIAFFFHERFVVDPMALGAILG